MAHVTVEKFIGRCIKIDFISETVQLFMTLKLLQIYSKTSQ
jgi:hypothetical protein